MAKEKVTKSDAMAAMKELNGLIRNHPEMGDREATITAEEVFKIGAFIRREDWGRLKSHIEYIKGKFLEATGEVHHD